MKYLWKIALCCLASTIIVLTGHAGEITTPSCQLARCQWTSHELFEHIVGFKSEPMNAMMEQLTPHNPELWEAYTDTIGNLLLANLYLGRDKEALIQGTHELRFHPEMTYACVYSMTQVSYSTSAQSMPLRKRMELYKKRKRMELYKKRKELCCLANVMDHAIYKLANGMDGAVYEYDAGKKAIAEYITVLYQQGLISSPACFVSTNTFFTPIWITKLDKASLPFSCPGTYSIFATKSCEQTVWFSKEDIVAIESDKQFPGDGPNLVDSLTRHLPTSTKDAL